MGKDGEPEVTETRTDGRDDTSRGFLFTFHSASLIVPQPPPAAPSGHFSLRSAFPSFAFGYGMSEE